MQHECDTSETWVTRVRHECEMSVTQATRVRHECYTNDMSATWVKNFDRDTGKNIFSHPYNYYMACERLQGEELFHTKNYLFEMSRFHAVSMHLKSPPQKLNLLKAKAISKSCTRDCSCKCHCTFPHSYAQSANIIFDKNHFMWKYLHSF